eukprot:7377133-Prymnesium_polylepis.2
MSMRPDSMQEQARTFSLNQYFQRNTALVTPHVEAAPIAAPTRGTGAGFNFAISAHSLCTNNATAVGNKYNNNTSSVLDKSSSPDAVCTSTLSFVLSDLSKKDSSTFGATKQGRDSLRRMPAGYVHGEKDKSGE